MDQLNNMNITPQRQDDIQLNYHSELMEDFHLEGILDHVVQLKAVRLSDQNTLIFYIQEKKGQRSLHAMSFVDGSESGWNSWLLSSSTQQVSAFDVYDDDSAGLIKIAFSIYNGTTAELLTAQLNKNAKIEIAHLQQLENWQLEKIEARDQKNPLNFIALSADFILYSNQHETVDATYSYLPYGESSQIFTLPDHATEVLQVTQGTWLGESGCFILYQTASKQELIHKPFDTNLALEMLPLTDDHHLNGFRLIIDQKGETSIYMAGKGVFAYPPPADEFGDYEDVLIQLAVPEEGQEFVDLSLSRQGNEISLWLLDQKEQALFFMSNRFYNDDAFAIDDQAWNSPILMQKGVHQFSSLKHEGIINELYLVKDSQIVHLYQDGNSTQWYENLISLAHEDQMIRGHSHVAHISFTNETGFRSYDGAEVQLSSPEHITIINNGRKFRLTPEKQTFIVQGETLTISCPTTSLHSGSIILEAEWLQDAYTINPSQPILKKLDTVVGMGTTSSDLDQLCGRNGKPLLANAKSDDKNELYTVLNQLVKGADTMKNVPPKAVPTQNNRFGHSIGTVLQAIKNGYEKVKNFTIKLVKGAVEFVVEIAGKIYKWVAKTVVDIINYAEQVLKKLVKKIKDILDALAYLLDLNDMIETKDGLKHFFLNLLDSASAVVDNVKLSTDDFMDQVKAQILSRRAELKSNFEKVVRAHEKTAFQKVQDNFHNQGTGEQPDARQSWVTSKTGVLTKFVTNSAKKIKTDGDDSFLDSVFKAFGELQYALSEEGGNIVSHFQQVLKGKISFWDFCSYALTFLESLSLELARSILNALFNALKKLIKTIKDGLTYEFGIPLIGFILDLLREVGISSAIIDKLADFRTSLIDIICFILAVPVTIAYKIIFDEAPFQKHSKKQFVNAAKLVNL